MHVIAAEGARLPIKVWARPEDLVGFDSALAQACNLANHPLAFKHVALMPDFHVGYGMPIGGVFATEGGIVPNAVGVDIGCGMQALGLGIYAPDARELLEEWRWRVHEWRRRVHERVPVGEGRYHQQGQEIGFFDEALEADAQGCPIVAQNLERARLQLGTLGGGNHFIELQVAENGELWVMIHSGSRGIGHKVCTYYEREARKLNEKWHSAIPDRDLAFLPDDHDVGRAYLREMEWCLRFADANRRHMMLAVRAVLAELGLSGPTGTTVHTHHNYVAREHHFGRDPWVHRKGAVKADGLVCIPGSMGTASYVARGLGERESFGSCSHGAGRVLGRKEANRTISHEQAEAAMAHVVFGVRQGDYDEMPQCYKDIDQVMENQRDLAEAAFRLRPLAVVKG